MYDTYLLTYFIPHVNLHTLNTAHIQLTPIRERMHYFSLGWALAESLGTEVLYGVHGCRATDAVPVGV